MVRMNQRLLHGQSLHACEDWSTLILRQQVSSGDTHFISFTPLSPNLWARAMYNYNHGPKRDPYYDVHPRRRQGRPRHRWDDYVNRFCQYY